MPIRVPDELPAVSFLRNENVFAMTSSRAKTQQIKTVESADSESNAKAGIDRKPVFTFAL